MIEKKEIEKIEGIEEKKTKDPKITEEEMIAEAEKRMNLSTNSTETTEKTPGNLILS